MRTSVARQFARWTLAAGAVLAAGAAGAQTEIPGYGPIDNYDPREVAMLPKFCPHTILFSEKVPGGNNPDEIARWKSVLGDTFRHLHHYCWGLMKTNRAMLLARNTQTRQFYLGDSINEFNYVIERAPEDFVLLPEILSRKGQNLIRLGKVPLGMLELERAAQLKPDYWVPYAYMSDYYKESGDLRKAREQLEKGLQAAPDSTALKRRLEELEPGKSKTKAARPPAG